MSITTGTAIAILCSLAVVAAWVATRDAHAERATLAPKTDLRAVTPGLRTTMLVSDLELAVSVPPGEGHTGGTFRAAIAQVGFDSGAIPRDGSLEAAWVDDVNEDGEPDAVLVVRGGGSGSYASIVVVESSAGSFVVRPLPAAPATAGYMGHDEALVRGGQIIRSFPTYVDRPGLRIDRQWSAERGLDGEWPVKSDPDHNAGPSGKTVKLGFDRATGSWRELE